MKKKRKRVKQELSGEKIIKTLASSSTTKPALAETVVFSAHRSSKKKKVSDEDDDERDEISMDQARQDVFMFGLNALSRKDRVEAKVALAIKLGAIPAKNKCIPLQEYKERKKKEKVEELQRNEENESKLLRRTPSNKTGKGLAGKSGKGAGKTGRGAGKKGNEKNQLKMGSFDGGMLKISGSDIKKMTSKR